ncbi:hypothetical protein FHP25_25005 [Vineibacter terrae]|uniref:Uncharacterized protein n=1 Tax=Vineibacter terrae TaxID=2586908 RepID=A0A5C8PFH9_9HYPH|nr:hypothetical protein [Vineibacter terrae]TXL72558.1 hypothetical protein FHP25_25005 [Vineibacter terrae]
MSAPVSTKLALTFTPPGATGDPPPVYLYRPPTERQREQWRARVTSIAGATMSPARLREVAKAGIDALCDDAEDRAALLGLIDAAQRADDAGRDIATRAALVAVGRAAAAEDDPAAALLDAELAGLQAEAAAAALSPRQADQLEQLDAMLRRLHPPYARELERRMLWASLSPRVACSLFLTGWRDVIGRDGQRVPFKRVGGEVPDELIDRLPTDHAAIVGAQILTAIFPTGEDAKKPASPSGSPGVATSSSTTTEIPSSAQTAATAG